MTDFIRPTIRAMKGYTPGEQPQQGRVIKLNTNENPYPPSPRVLEALQQVLTADRLRKYPDPLGKIFRETAGRVLGVDPACILIGNGSDDLLTIITRAIVPEGGLIAAPRPSYLLYRTLAQIQGARCIDVPFTSAWRLEAAALPPGTHLTFLPNPNSPSGTLIPPEQLADWPTPLVLDEAYADFAPAHGLHLWRNNPRIIITRSLSKSYALAGLRFGFALGDPAVIAELYKVKDSYNCDALSLAAATAALADQSYMQTQRDKILATRQRLAQELARLGFQVTPSHANFVWCQRQDRPVQPLYTALKERNIFIRYLTYPDYGEGLRISVGTDEEIQLLLGELRKLV
jgi:histidinol-phosphate aminotransferase